MLCASCGKTLAETARFCPKCGTPVSAPGGESARPGAIPPDHSSEMTNDSVFVRTVNSVLNNDWLRQYKDLADGGDIVRWGTAFASAFIPALVSSGSVFSGVMRPYDAVDLIVPCFFDAQAVQFRQYSPGTKIRFNGDFARGYLLFTGGDIVSIWEDSGLGGFEINRNSLSDIIEQHEMEFRVSKLSMTAAEKGYEVLFHSHRILFRVAFMAKSDRFYSIFTNRLGGTYIPLFKGMRCVDWVTRDSPDNPKDETGELRHWPNL